MPAKRKLGFPKKDVVGKVKDFVMDNIVSRIDKIINDAVIVNGILKKLDEMKNKFLRTLMAMALVIIGVVFILIGLAQYLSSILEIFEGSGFVIVGVIVLIIGLIYKASKESF